MIEAAAGAGADCVKTQVIFADEIIHPETGHVDLPGGRIKLYDRFKELERDFDFYQRFKEMTEAAGLLFLASPFGLKSLEYLTRMDCKIIKIASPELNHFELLRAASSPERTLFVSTGVSTMTDIEKALDCTGSENTVLLHCVTAYPAPEEEYNLKVLETLAGRFNVRVGISDHSLDPVLVPVISAVLGARFVEKHFTLEKKGEGLDDPIALSSSGFKQMVSAVREAENSTEAALEPLIAAYGKERIELVMGTGEKTLAPSESENYGRTNRSIHALGKLKKGEVLSASNTAILRTEKVLKPGAPPEHYSEFLGKKVKRVIDSGQGICFEDIE
jgi:sialic acid synthase SpsE